MPNYVELCWIILSYEELCLMILCKILEPLAFLEVRVHFCVFEYQSICVIEIPNPLFNPIDLHNLNKNFDIFSLEFFVESYFYYILS